MRTNEPEATKRTPAPAAPRRARRSPAAAAAPVKARKAATRQPAAFPGDEDIRLRAYQFYVERGWTAGDPVADWVRAERELIAERLPAESAARSRKTTRSRA